MVGDASVAEGIKGGATVEPGAVHIITTLLDEYGERLSGFRDLAIRLATSVDQTADGPVKVDVSSQGIQISVDQIGRAHV